MYTVKEVSRLTGVSVRTLQYYDKLGLLSPSARTAAGYRLYGDAELERLQQILLFRELSFPLKDIARILSSPSFERSRALEQQITLLTMQKEHLENLILLARGIKMTGINTLSFTAFERSDLDVRMRHFKESWSQAPQFREFEKKDHDRTDAERTQLQAELLQLIADFGPLMCKGAAHPAVQTQVGRLQAFITMHCYTCTDAMLAGLGRIFTGGGEVTTCVEEAAGAGAGRFIADAIDAFVKQRAAK